MMVYIAATRTKRLLERFEQLGWGAMYCRGYLTPPRLSKWCYDNGAFTDWRAGRSFDERAWRYDMERLPSFSPQPQWCVLPDLVARGRESLMFSMSYFDRFPRPDWYLAVQNGMTRDDVPWTSGIAGIFVGGDLRWKAETTPMWCEAAHAHRLPVHVGRIGTPRRVLWARNVGVDSIDSSFPLWTRNRMEEFESSVYQQTLFGEKP